MASKDHSPEYEFKRWFWLTIAVLTAYVGAVLTFVL